MVACAIALLFASTASGATILTPYNAIVSGNFTDNSADMGGGLAAGGSIYVPNNWTVANSLGNESLSAFTNSTTLNVVGSVYQYGTTTAGHINLTQGNYWIGGSGTSSGTKETATQVNFTTAFQNFDDAAASTALLAQTSGDSATIVNNYLTIAVTHTGLNVITVNAADLAAADGIKFDFSSGVTYATLSGDGNAWVELNVAGTTIQYTASNWGVYACDANGGNCVSQTANAAYLAEDVLYNFYQATTVNVTSGGNIVVGTFLAPYADVTDSSGQEFVGSLIAKSFVGNNEFHNFAFTGPIVPEPAPFAGVGLGLLGLAYIRKRRRA